MKFDHFFITSLFVVITLFSTPSKADWQDLQNGFEIVESTPRKNNYARSYYVDVEIENSGLSVLDGPLRLVIDNASLVVSDSDGLTDSGAPYLNLSIDKLAPGERHQMRVNFELGNAELAFELRLQAENNFVQPNLSPIANANVDKTANEETTIILQGTGTDTDTDTDLFTIAFLPDNESPVAEAGADQSVNEETLVALSGSGTDSDGSIASYRWSQIAGQTVLLTNPNSATSSFNSPTTTTTITLIFELTVTDNEGASTSDTVTITVNPVANIAPFANAGADQSVNEETLVTLAGSGSDSDGSVASYRWVQIAGQTVTLISPNNATTRFNSPTSTTVRTLIFRLTVTDNEGASTSDTVAITVNPLANIAPLANAGVDQSVNEETLVALSGSGSDSDGSVASYRWAQIAGQTVSLTNPNSATSSFNSPTTTTTITLIFKLTVTDNEGAATSDTVTITVNPVANIAPFANAGADQSVNEETLVTLAGSGSDSDGSVASYRWVQIAGQTVTLISPNNATTRFNSPTSTTVRTLIFRLTVTDNEDAATSDTVTITVNPLANIAPLANAGTDQSVNEETLVALSGSGSDSDGSVASYRWSQIAGQTVSLTNPNSATSSFNSPTTTTTITLIFKLTVTDNEGAATSDTVTITVNPLANIAPIANAGVDQSVNEETLVALSGSGSDSDGSVASYRWSQIAGQTVSLTNPNSATSSFNSPTTTTTITLIFKLTVTDNEGAATSDTVTITVNPVANIAPLANAGADQSVNEETLVTLAGSGSDSDGSVASYRWVQIAGQTVTLISPNNATTRFDSPTSTTVRTLIFRLTVTDNEGAATSDTVTITVNPLANIAPLANAGVDQSVNEETLVALSGSGSDSDGSVASYRWAQIAGRTVALTSPNNATTNFTSPATTTTLTLIFRLTVTDNEGAATNDTVVITVNPGGNIAPLANAGADQSVNEETLVTLAGSGSDSDGSVASYRWVKIAGKSVSLINRTNATTRFNSPTSTTVQTIVFRLTVTDNEGAATSDTVTITVNPLPAQTLTVTGENDGNNFVVSWNDVGADSYRVLFWDNDGNVYGPTTASLSLSISSAIRRLGGSLVVEAYDARGNSVFSSPINVEAL